MFPYKIALVEGKRLKKVNPPPPPLIKIKPLPH